MKRSYQILLSVIFSSLLYLLLGAANGIAHFHDVVRDERGRVVSSASVAVYVGATTDSLAVIYSDRAGLIAKSNPTTSDASGIVSFYASAGTYTLVISRAGILTQTVADIDIGQPAVQISVQDLLYSPSATRSTSTGVVTVNGLTPLNALAFGVDISGATDATPQLQAAVDSAIAWKYQTLQIPGGICLLEDTLMVRGRLQIIGDGTAATELKIAHQGPGILVSRASGALTYAVEVQNLRINSQDSTSTAIEFRNTSECCVRNVNINGDFEVGMRVRGGAILSIYDCDVSYCDTGIVLSPSAILGIDNISIDRANVWQSQYVGLLVEGSNANAHQLHMQDCWFEYNPTQIKVSTASGHAGIQRSTIENCSFRNASYARADTATCSFFVSNSDTSKYMIVDNVVFRGCVFYDQSGNHNVRLVYNHDAYGSTCNGLRFEDCAFYGANQGGVLTDVAYTSVEFAGRCTFYDDWASGNATTMIRGGGQRILNLNGYNDRVFSVATFDTVPLVPTPYRDAHMYYSKTPDALKFYTRAQWLNIPMITVGATAPTDTAGRKGCYFWLKGDTLRVYTGSSTPPRWKPLN